jgi:pimeloyl-ACP methyl ester carboxylesterase
MSSSAGTVLARREVAGLAFSSLEYEPGVTLGWHVHPLPYLSFVDAGSHTEQLAGHTRHCGTCDPVRDSTFMAAISPARHADRIKAPLLVVQGAQDPVVPPAESEDIVRIVRGHGGEAEYLLFPDEGHGIGKDEDYIKAYETMLAFLRRHMPPPPGLGE